MQPPSEQNVPGTRGVICGGTHICVNFTCTRHPHFHIMMGVIRWSQIIPLGKKEKEFYLSFFSFTFQSMALTE